MNISAISLFIKAIVILDHNLPAIHDIVEYMDEKCSDSSFEKRLDVLGSDYRQRSINEKDEFYYSYPEKLYKELLHIRKNGRKNGMNTIGVIVGYSDEEVLNSIKTIKNTSIESKYGNSIKVDFFEIEAVQLLTNDFDISTIEKNKDGGIILAKNFDEFLSSSDLDIMKMQVIESIIKAPCCSDESNVVPCSCSLIVFGSEITKNFFMNFTLVDKNIEVIQKGNEHKSSIYVKQLEDEHKKRRNDVFLVFYIVFIIILIIGVVTAFLV